MTDDTTTKTGLRPVEVGVGAGAAVITAFASSYLGTAGTLAGAAVASVVGTVSTSLLRSSADASAQRLRQTTAKIKETRVQWADPADPRPVEHRADVDPYGTQLFGASDWIDHEASAGPTGTHPTAMGQPGVGPTDSSPNGTGQPGSGPTDNSPSPDRTGSVGSGRTSGSTVAGGRAALGKVRPRWVVLGAGAVTAFAFALIAITGIESAAGKPLAGLVGKDTGGGTTIGRATGSDADSGTDQPSPTPTPTSSTGGAGATSTQPASPSNSTPTGGLSATPAPSATSPNPAPSPTQQAPTQAPSPSPNPLTSQTP